MRVIFFKRPETSAIPRNPSIIKIPANRIGKQASFRTWNQGQGIKEGCGKL